MTRPSALVTGATSGIGFLTAVELARREPERTILVHGRSERRAAEAVAAIKERFGVENLEPVWGEFDSLAGVEALAGRLDARREGVDLLVLAAGVQNGDDRARSGDGLELTFAVNVFANVRLLDLLSREPKPKRVVIFSSGTHNAERKAGLPTPTHVDPERLAHPDRDLDSAKESAFTRGSRAYTASKAAVVMLAYAYARERPWLRIDALDPQLTPGTGLARTQPAFVRLLWRRVLPALVPAVGFMNRPAAVARAAAQVSLDPELARGTGRYFEVRNGHAVEARSSELTYDIAAQKALLDGSRRLVAKPNAEDEAWRRPSALVQARSL